VAPPEVAKDNGREPDHPPEVDSKWLAVMVSSLAFGLACYQACDLATTRRNGADLEAIRTSYQIFRDLTRAGFEHPQLMHLFETTPQSYRRAVRGVRVSIGNATGQERARFRLEERAMADHIFTFYEEIYFNWQHARRVNGSADLLEQDLTGYLPSLLCNARLRWYWESSGGALGYNYSDELHRHYDDQIRPKCPSQPADANGPFAATDTPEDSQ
jgi:hypothetical protein